MRMETNWKLSRYMTETDRKSKRALSVAMSELRRYAEPYVRFSTGNTMRSAHMASDISKGLVIYDTPYAHYTYYNTRSKVSTDHHPEARARWGEYAWDKHKAQILERAKKEYEKA